MGLKVLMLTWEYPPDHGAGLAGTYVTCLKPWSASGLGNRAYPGVHGGR